MEGSIWGMIFQNLNGFNWKLLAWGFENEMSDSNDGQNFGNNSNLFESCWIGFLGFLPSLEK